MTYIHLSMNELVIIKSYFHQNISVSKISRLVRRARQMVHNIIVFKSLLTLRLIITTATKKMLRS